MTKTRTLDGEKLRNINITGRGLTSDVRDATANVKFGVAYDEVTGMTLTINDTMDLGIFRSGVMSSGSTISYGQWWNVIEDNAIKSGPIGPQLSVTALSRSVTRLRAQTGAKNWGVTDVSAWVTARIKEVGGIPVVQPGLGRTGIVREAGEPGGEKPNTWDVMVQMQRQAGVWLFEYGPRIIFGKPSWLMGNLSVRKTYDFRWTNYYDYSAALDGLPEYNHRPKDNPKETMTLRLVSADADEIAPGDQVNMSGNIGGMAGRWIVAGVDYPFTVAAPVVVHCVRPIDPEKEPPPGSGGGVSGVNIPNIAARVRGREVNFPKATLPGVTLPGGGGGIAPHRSPAGLIAATQRWAASVNGRAIDMDGAFGAQCVDLSQHFNRNVVGGGFVWGNGRDWFGAAPSANYTRVSPGANPQVGDIACWGPAMGGGYGHVAIVMSEDFGVGVLRCMSQNPGPSRLMTLTKSGLQGYLRPRRWR